MKKTIIASILFGSLCAPALASVSDGLNVINDLRGSLNKKVAIFYSSACKADHNDNAKLNLLENIYFPLAAKKFTNMNRCEVLTLSKLSAEGAKSSFINKVVVDISVKLKPLRTLKQKIDDLTAQIEILNKESFADDAQLARFGYLSAADQRLRMERNAEISNLQFVLAPKLIAYELLFSSIWRSKSKEMSQYLTALIESDITPVNYRTKALQGTPGLIEKYWKGNFSIIDTVILPMKEEAQDSIDLMTSQIVKTDQGSRFNPGFSTRQVLVSNMDMLYSSNHPSDSFQGLACHLDQKYISGDEALKKTLSVASFFAGTSAKLIPVVLRLSRLEKLVRGSQYIAKATSFLATTSTIIGLGTTVQSAYEACHRQFDHVISGNDICSTKSSINEIENYEYRNLSKGNCALSLITGLLATVGADAISSEISDLLGKNPDLAIYMAQIGQISQVAAEATDQALTAQDHAGIAQDFIDLMMTEKSKPKAK